MSEDMDFDAGRVLTGEITLAQAGDELRDLVVRVAAGQPSKPEALGPSRVLHHVQAPGHAALDGGVPGVKGRSIDCPFGRR